MQLLKIALEIPPDHRPILQHGKLHWHNSVTKSKTWKKGWNQFCCRIKNHNMEMNSWYHIPQGTTGRICSTELESHIPQSVQETSDLAGEKRKSDQVKAHTHDFLPLSEDFKHFRHQLNYTYMFAPVLSLSAEGSNPQWGGGEGESQPSSITSTSGFLHQLWIDLGFQNFRSPDWRVCKHALKFIWYMLPLFIASVNTLNSAEKQLFRMM